VFGSLVGQIATFAKPPNVMRNILTTATATSILTLLCASTFTVVTACECSKKLTVEEEIKRSDAVIVATAISRHDVAITDTTIVYHFTTVRYDFLVERVYKGTLTKDTVFFYTASHGPSCGKHFDIGTKYIIYGDKEHYFEPANLLPADNSYWTHSCKRTTIYNQTEVDEIEKFIK
jgi:hypothetical protein